MFLPRLTSLKYVHVNKRPYITCVNDVEMWVLEEKKFIFVNRIIKSSYKKNNAK